MMRQAPIETSMGMAQHISATSYKSVTVLADELADYWRAAYAEGLHDGVARAADLLLAQAQELQEI